MSNFNSTSAPRGYSAVPARFNSTSAPCVPADSWRCANGHLHQAWPPDPSPAQPADPPTPQQRYDQARRDGLSEHEARAVGWPGVTFCGHTAEEGCTGHGDF